MCQLIPMRPSLDRLKLLRETFMYPSHRLNGRPRLIPATRAVLFRGSVASLDAGTGELLWNSFVIAEEPADTGELNSEGAKRFGPSGAPVWNTPTIDLERGVLYVGTGDLIPHLPRAAAMR